MCTVYHDGLAALNGLYCDKSRCWATSRRGAQHRDGGGIMMGVQYRDEGRQPRWQRIVTEQKAVSRRLLRAKRGGGVATNGQIAISCDGPPAASSINQKISMIG